MKRAVPFKSVCEIEYKSKALCAFVEIAPSRHAAMQLDIIILFCLIFSILFILTSAAASATAAKRPASAGTSRRAYRGAASCRRTAVRIRWRATALCCRRPVCDGVAPRCSCCRRRCQSVCRRAPFNRRASAPIVKVYSVARWSRCCRRLHGLRRTNVARR